jgi:3-hydroxyisobutyrate dehydrogenase
MNADRNLKIAVLGVGTMGTGMAHSLVRAGFRPTLWDRDPARLAPFAGTDAATVPSVPDAVRGADVVITMVSDAEAVMNIADDNGMLDALTPGAVWVQMSTIGVAGFERASAFAAERRPDIMLVDAPVTGSRQSAESGALTIFASGPDAARRRVGPVFDALGQRTLWLGPAGLGSRLKLANNTMIAFVVQGLGEAVSVAHDLDVPTDALMKAFDSAAFASPYVASKLARIERDQYDAEFSLALALKDVKLALDTVDPAHHPVLAALARQWQQATDEGLGPEDLTVITRQLDHGASSKAAVSQPV